MVAVSGSQACWEENPSRLRKVHSDQACFVSIYVACSDRVFADFKCGQHCSLRTALTTRLPTALRTLQAGPHSRLWSRTCVGSVSADLSPELSGPVWVLAQEGRGLGTAPWGSPAEPWLASSLAHGFSERGLRCLCSCSSGSGLCCLLECSAAPPLRAPRSSRPCRCPCTPGSSPHTVLAPVPPWLCSLNRCGSHRFVG